MIDRVLQTIRDHKMLRQGDNVMVCVSGGADSMALLLFFMENREGLSLGSLTACHFNHGLRGAESDADEKLVRDFCAQNGIPLLVGKGNMSETALPRGESTESYARRLRYAFFEDSAKETGATRVAVAHNRNDVVETILFNLARGTGIKGARGMPAVRGDIIRPLYDVGRQEIERYCAQKGIAYAVDSTNVSTDYARNRIRHAVLPQLQQVNAAAPDNIARFGAQAGEAWAFIETLATEQLKRAETPDGYDVAAFSAQHPVLAKTMLKLLAERQGVEMQEKTVAAAQKLLAGELREVQLSEGLYLRREKERLLFRQDTAASIPAAEMPLQLGVNYFCAGVEITARIIEEQDCAAFIENSKNILNNSIDYDKITGNVVLRSKKEGDRFTSSRRGNTKSLKKLLSEKHIAPALRNGVAVLSDDAGILWVMDEGVAQRAAVTGSTKRILYIQAGKGEEQPCTATC